MLAAHSPKTVLLGVTTVHGNSSLVNTTCNTRSVLEAIGHRVPVYSGTSKPLQREAVHAPEIHGESGIDGVTLLPKPIEPAVENADFLTAMYDALKQTTPGTAWLVTTGTLTNAAKLFMTHPDIIDHLAGLSIMGGAIGGGFTNAPMGKVAESIRDQSTNAPLDKVPGEVERFGNYTSFAEFNVSLPLLFLLLALLTCLLDLCKWPF